MLKTCRPSKGLQHLNGFWGGYFNAPNSSLTAFGPPSLDVDLQ